MLFVNPHSRSLTIAATGQTVGPGETVDVPDDIAESLRAQGWVPESDTPKKKSTRADTPAAPEEG